jgi:hypothetical protein
VSETSTVEHDQEPFETFQHKIRDLILQLYPQVCSEAIEIQRITGGSFNRIIGVRFPNAYGRQQHNFLYKLRKLLAIRGNFNRTPIVSFEDLIVRIPRDSTVGLKYQVATLKYVETRIGYPVPQVIAFQPSPDKNPLAQGYMIQRRLAGQPLHQIWNNLTFGQKKSAVRQITQILINLNKVMNDSPGICSPSCNLESYPVPAFGISEPKFTKPHVFPSKPITTKDLLLSPPQTSEEAEFKRIFDQMVGADYLRYAYGPEFILARRMFKILLNGIDWQGDLDKALEIIAEFEKLYFSMQNEYIRIAKFAHSSNIIQNRTNSITEIPV